MNRFFRICFLCVAGACLFFAGMWVSSYLLYKSEYKEYDGGTIITETSERDSFDNQAYVETTAEDTIDLDTQFVIIKENLVTGVSEEITEELPAQFVGMERDELEKYYDEYENSPVLKDREEGFISASVESYSPDRLVVKKVYEPLQLQEKFYLKAEENYVVVYYGDNSTVYMYTNICLDTLPGDTKAEIEAVKEIETYESLYSFLESYTS